MKISCDSSRTWVLTDIRDFTTLFYVILRRKSSEWFESSIESNLGMWFTIWNLDLAVLDFAFLKHCFWYMEQVIKKSIFVIRENEILISVIRDPLFFPLVSGAKDPPIQPSRHE